ncbi:hypothetical protein MM440_03050 [Arsenicicoccus piscis]|uniref:SLC13 family permease n=1 Tax=Arsenicicoccus piscis TaxID=673954 RepID=UPI001F4D185A|nr:hypothetical protein [Arsenicicoccus piscis]
MTSRADRRGSFGLAWLLGHRGLILLLLGVLVVATGLLPWADARPVLERAAPVLGFLVLIKLVADLCDDADLFDLVAHGAARLARGRTAVLYLLFCGVGIVATWVLSLDTTAVLLTPIALALAAELGVAPLPFAFASVWLANAASLLLPVSNLTNLLAQHHLSLTSGQFMHLLTWPQAAVLVVVVGTLLVRHRTALRGRYPVSEHLPKHDPWLVWPAALVATATGPAIVAGVEAWEAALGGFLVLLVAFVVRQPGTVVPRRLVRLAPWDMAAFALGLFLVIAAVMRPAHTLVAEALGAGTGAGDLLQLAGVATVLANATNNLPTYLALEPFAAEPARAAALLVAVNVGPVVLIWGSLANLLWRDRCRVRGLEVSSRRFALEGLLVMPTAVAAGVLAVALAVAAR